MGVLGFYGKVTIMNMQCFENEQDGMVFSKTIDDPSLINREQLLQDEAQFLDFADCTDRSLKPFV